MQLAQAAKTAVVDARGLADALARNLRGEVRFDDGSRALYATDASNYRQVPIGVVIPRDVEDVIATVAPSPANSARPFCAAAAAPAWPASAATSPSCWTFEVHDQHPGDRSRARLARVQPGMRAGRSARRRREASPDLRPRSRDPQPLHARRHDRQQLLRRAFA